jgi:hypothetical protein
MELMPKLRPYGGPLTVEDIDRAGYALGVVGEARLFRTLYFIGTSRKNKRPLGAIVMGASSSGKTALVSQCARLMPVKEIIMATRMTPQALYHFPPGFVEHKFIVGGERVRVQDDAAADATAALRQLFSEGRAVKQMTVRDGGEENKWITDEMEVKGPIAYVETTTMTKERVFVEDLNRALVLRTNDAEAVTRAVLTSCAERSMGRRRVNPDWHIERHRKVQEQLLRYDIVVPFADRILDRFPARKVEARRAGQQVISMVEAIALFHQSRRRIDDNGRLIAQIEDYALAVDLLRGPLGEAMGVGARAAGLYHKIAAKFKRATFTTSAVQKIEDASERSVRDWLWELREARCVDLVEPGKGQKPATWQLNGLAPDECVLPAPESIETT